MVPVATSRIDPRRHEGKAALVVGGASGLGEACARRLAAEGARVAILDMDEGRGGALAEELRQSGRACVFAPVDVTDNASVEAATTAVRQSLDGLDIAVNSAGIAGDIAPLAEYPVDGWDRVIAVNLTGVFHCMRAQLQAMIARGGGSIVNLSSVNVVATFPMIPAYVAAKHAIVGLTRAAALENGPRGIRVNAVAPTVVKTPMTAPTMPDDMLAELATRHALQRLPQADEIAAAVSFLASDDAGFLTGTVQVVDGGYSLS